ncbi:carbohydrate ABC transporter permease [Isoptericola variabilis]|uniref:ABC-type transporter, integral membrane subunit n=1 Tax=Isoptericola variabilis (strain 225) TaxID=743718 RepID=F6FS55_ISOV2|nr:sugar ABC transporter permease [Isoptericola variabilis]AEG45152.1 ABC-type transporter, integral membrane subunit [Isoptericola variabilis 225]TWH31444.1 cellobiose ABC transporter membrane protein [Isoptericola variabilis J7]
MAVLSTSQPAPPRGAPPARPPRRVGFSQRLGRWDVKVSPYLYISPFFVLFALTGLFPLIYTAFVSVHQWNLLGGQGDFVGLQNYTDVLNQPIFWRSLVNTVSIFILSSIPQVLLAITIAALLDQNLRAATFWRMGVLVPYIVAPVAVSMIFGRMFADQYGFINALLGIVGIDPVGWHSDRFASHVAIATIVNYRWTGYNALIFLAAMQAVPRELYEAAVIDGAGRVRQFFSVTVPQIRATIIFVVITSTIGGLQIFDEVRMYDAAGLGGPSKNWMTTVLYLYDVAWGNQKNFGRAAAVAWILFLLIIAIGMINFLVTRRISTSGPSAPKVSRKHTKALLERARAAGSSTATPPAAGPTPGTGAPPSGTPDAGRTATTRGEDR